jgi:hypothetical protein
MFDVSGRFVNFGLTTNLSLGSTPCLSLATAPSSGARTARARRYVYRHYNWRWIRAGSYITLRLASDAQKAVEAVKRYELKCKYGYALTQDLKAADKYVKDEYKSIHI